MVVGATLNLATTEVWNDKGGQRQEKTEWHTVVIFNEGLAKIAEQYLKKGSSIYVEGQLQTRKWTDKEGVERFTTEVNASSVVFLGKGEANGNVKARPGAAPAPDEDFPF